ncbi:hypothetical protein PFISCL1PPCAC_12780, partial [Pristionchus fissidentatus]
SCIASILGIAANIIMIYLTSSKTPHAIAKYARILFFSAVCDLTGAAMYPLLIPRVDCYGATTVISYKGLCTLSHRPELCWICTGIIEMMFLVNDAFICVSFYFRLRVLRRATPS